MAALDDLIAKHLAAAALKTRGAVFPEHEIPMMDAQAADLYFEPRGGKRRTGPLFRLVDEMTSESGTLEFCAHTPGPKLMYRSYLRKHLELYQGRCLEAERGGKPVPEMQGQWILTPGRPVQALQELPCVPEAGWAEGSCYRFTPGLKVRFVVLSALPRTRETLLLRLLGPLPLRQQALEEVKQVSPKDPEAPELAAMLACVNYLIEKDPRIPRAEKERFMNVNAVLEEFEQFKQDLVKKGLEQGLEQGQARTILKVLQARGVMVSEAIRQRILSCKDTALLDQWAERAALAHTIEDVIGA